MTTLRAWLRRPVLIALLLTGLAFAADFFARAAGLLVPLDLLVYDLGLRLQTGDSADPRIVLVTQTEEDLNRIGFPASDAALARILEKLAAADASAIGVDIYRDIPVPPGQQELERTLKAHANIVWIIKFSDAGGRSVPPPSALADAPAQVGFNDLVDDPGGVIRRGLISLDDGKQQAWSLPLQLALKHMRGKGMGADPHVPEHLRLGDTTIAPFEQDDGGYVNADAAGYQFLLDFKGAHGRFPRYSFSQVLNYEFDIKSVAGKVVIVGSSAISLNDYFYTPFSLGRSADQRMIGAELQGHATSQLLRYALDGERPRQVLSEAAELAWLALWCLLGALVGYASRSLFRFLIAAIGAMLALATLSYLLFALNVWLPPVAPLAGALACITLIAAFMSQQEQAQRKALMQLFSKYVSKDIAEEVWRHREEFFEKGRPRPHQFTATVLFTDIKGFTNIAERLSPAELMNWLNEYMSEMTAVVIAHRGVINKYMGDAVMAIFGAPLAHSDHAGIATDARNAVDCALAMEAALDKLNLVWAARDKDTIAMRIGIFTGPLIAGSLGGGERLEYTVIGDTVNVASRLESFDKSFVPPDGPQRSCRILIGASTQSLVRDLFATIPVGAVELKGKDERVSVYYLLKSGMAKTSSTEAT